MAADREPVHYEYRSPDTYIQEFWVNRNQNLMTPPRELRLRVTIPEDEILIQKLESMRRLEGSCRLALEEQGSRIIERAEIPACVTGDNVPISWYRIRVVRIDVSNMENHMCTLVKSACHNIGVVMGGADDGVNENTIQEWLTTSQCEWVVALSSCCRCPVWLRADIILQAKSIRELIRPPDHTGHYMASGYGIGAEDLTRLVIDYFQQFVASTFHAQFVDVEQRRLEAARVRRSWWQRVFFGQDEGEHQEDEGDEQYLIFVSRFHTFLCNYTGGSTHGDVAALFLAIVARKPTSVETYWSVVCHLLRTFEERLGGNLERLPTGVIPSPHWDSIRRAMIYSRCNGLFVRLPIIKNPRDIDLLVSRALLGLRLPYVHGGFVHRVRRPETWWSCFCLLFPFDKSSWPLRQELNPYLYVGRTGPTCTTITPVGDTFKTFSYSFRKSATLENTILSQYLDTQTKDVLLGDCVETMGTLLDEHEPYVLTIVADHAPHSNTYFADLRASMTRCFDGVGRLPGPALHWDEIKNSWQNIVLDQQAMKVTGHRQWRDSFSVLIALTLVAAPYFAETYYSSRKDLFFGIAGILLAGGPMNVQLPVRGIFMALITGRYWGVWLQNDELSYFFLSAILLIVSATMNQEQSDLDSRTGNDDPKFPGRKTIAEIEKKIDRLENLGRFTIWFVAAVSFICLCHFVFPWILTKFHRKLNPNQDSRLREIWLEIRKKDGTVFGLLSGGKDFKFRCGDVTSIGLSWLRAQDGTQGEDIPGRSWFFTRSDARIQPKSWIDGKPWAVVG